MGDDEQVTIVCADWSEEVLMAIPGNRTAECECGRPVVISLQGRKMKGEHPDAEIKCFACVLKEAPDAEVYSVPGAVDAARAAGAPVRWRKGMTVAEFVRDNDG